MNSEKIEDLNLLIANNYRIGIFFHTYPDWDCLGSAFALRQLIKDNYENKSIRVLGDRKGKLFFLGLEGLNTQLSLPEDFKKGKSLAIVVDTYRKEKIDKKELLDNFEHVAIIDHHNPFDEAAILKSTLHISDSSFISCSELILHIAEKLNWHINEKTASFLYCGLFGDSQGFTNYNVKEKSFENAAKLVKLGADITTINQNIEKKDLIHEKLKSQLIIVGKLVGKKFYSILTQDLLDVYKSRFNTESRLFYIAHSINIRGADVIGIWFQYINKLVVTIHKNYKVQEVKNLGYLSLRNNGKSYSYVKNFDKGEDIEKELDRVISCLL